MKLLALSAACAVGLGLAGCATAGSYYEDPSYGSGGGVSVGVFYDTLSPYGEWVMVPSYGRVWRPSVAVVGADFRPYSNAGHWVYTDQGWSWQSEYDWGWAPFHYGRWFADASYGWVWAPDTVWAPAWVDWRFGGGYSGWVPLAPAGYIYPASYQPAFYVVPTRYMVAANVGTYVLPPSSATYHSAIAVTAVVNAPAGYGSARWNAGPPVEHVAAAVGQPIHPVSIRPPPPGHVQPVHVPTPSYVRAMPRPVARPTAAMGTPGGRPNPAYPTARPGVLQHAPAPAPSYRQPAPQMYRPAPAPAYHPPPPPPRPSKR